MENNSYFDSIGLGFALIQAGSFIMGGGGVFKGEQPMFEVTITRPFYLGLCPVTQAQWGEVMGGNPSQFKGLENPVEMVSWNDVQGFIRRLNEREGHGRFRLPTEAEWEYAARAGTVGDYFFGDNPEELDRYGWYNFNSEMRTHPVGQKLPNAWGLYDVYGNVYEWVEDWCDHFPVGTILDPKGPSEGSARVNRGGSWYSSHENCRSGSRACFAPQFRFDSIGFRLAMTISESDLSDSLDLA